MPLMAPLSTYTSYPSDVKMPVEMTYSDVLKKKKKKTPGMQDVPMNVSAIDASLTAANS